MVILSLCSAKNRLLKVLIRVTKSLVEAIRENSFFTHNKTKIKSPERNSKRVMDIVKQNKKKRGRKERKIASRVS